jgi:hypothetical protein
VISGGGASDFIAAQGGLDSPESGDMRMAQARDSGPPGDRERFQFRQAPDTARHQRDREPEERQTGSQTGTVGGGGMSAYNPAPVRATGTDEDPGVDEEDGRGRE